MKLNEYAKSRGRTLRSVREAAREMGFPSDHHNSTITDGKVELLDRWFAVLQNAPGGDVPAETTTAGEPLAELFAVELPLCLLGKRVVRTTCGATLDERKAAAFSIYQQAGGILGSRYVPMVTPIDDPAGIDLNSILESHDA